MESFSLSAISSHVFGQVRLKIFWDVVGVGQNDLQSFLAHKVSARCHVRLPGLFA